ncbi:MAG: transglutaminase-like domain-containing protein, partial [Myxococcota bacterium]
PSAIKGCRPRTLRILCRVRGLHPLIALGRQWPARLLDLEHRGRISVDGTWGVSMPRTSLTVTYGVDLSERAPPVELPNAAQRKVRQRWLSLPQGLDPRIEMLGNRLTATATTSADKIDAVLSHFDSNYAYSLDPIPGNSPDPLARFLFEARQGHCELYAGAVAVLLRVAGVPARVVTGYYGGWWNSPGQALEFTEQDAHAWVEAFDPTRGWIWVDATPPSLRARRRGKALGWLRDIYDTLEAMWFNNIIDFDEKKRRDFLGSVLPNGWFKDVHHGSYSVFDNDSADGQTPRNAGWLLLLLAAVGIVVAVIGFRFRRRKSFSLGRVLRRALDPNADPSTPLEKLIARVPDALQAQTRTVVDDYQAWRFGVKTPRKPPPELVKAVGQLRKTLGRGRTPSV